MQVIAHIVQSDTNIVKGKSLYLFKYLVFFPLYTFYKELLNNLQAILLIYSHFYYLSWVEL